MVLNKHFNAVNLCNCTKGKEECLVTCYNYKTLFFFVHPVLKRVKLPSQNDALKVKIGLSF